MWTRLPVCRASMTSRATTDSSAMPGQRQPSRPEQLALVGTGVGTGEARVLRVLADHAAKALTYSSARRISRASTQYPSSENTRTRAGSGP